MSPEGSTGRSWIHQSNRAVVPNTSARALPCQSGVTPFEIRNPLGGGKLLAAFLRHKLNQCSMMCSSRHIWMVGQVRIKGVVSASSIQRGGRWRLAEGKVASITFYGCNLCLTSVPVFIETLVSFRRSERGYPVSLQHANGILNISAIVTVSTQVRISYRVSI